MALAALDNLVRFGQLKVDPAMMKKMPPLQSCAHWQRN